MALYGLPLGALLALLVMLPMVPRCGLSRHLLLESTTLYVLILSIEYRSVIKWVYNCVLLWMGSTSLSQGHVK
jgi:hypothetical protein